MKNQMQFGASANAHSSRVYRSRKTFKVNDTFLWMGRHWKVIFEYPAKNWFDEQTAYCVVPA